MNAARALLEKHLETLRERRRDATETLRKNQEAAETARALVDEAKAAIAEIEAALAIIAPPVA